MKLPWKHGLPETGREVIGLIENEKGEFEAMERMIFEKGMWVTRIVEENAYMEIKDEAGPVAWIYLEELVMP